MRRLNEGAYVTLRKKKITNDAKVVWFSVAGYASTR